MAAYVYSSSGGVGINGPRRVFSHVASGGLTRLRGCVPFSVWHVYRTRYKERDVVFSRRAAKKGVLEAVAVKRVGNVGPGRVTLYTDTYNSLWREDMLQYQSEAVAEARLYWLRVAADAKRAAED